MIIIIVTNRLEIGPIDQISGFLLKHIKAPLTFPNPAYQEAERRGFSTWNIPKEIRGYQVEGDTLFIPRGFTRQLVKIIQGAGLRYQIEDRRRTLAEVDFTFNGELRDFQEAAIEEMIARDFGTLAAPDGSGKTIGAIDLVQ